MTSFRLSPPPPAERVVNVLWMNAGPSCAGDPASLTAATLPGVEELALGALPGLPKVQFHWPLVDHEVGSDLLRWFLEGDAGRAVEFDRAAACAGIRAVRPGLRVLEISAKIGAGLDEWLALPGCRRTRVSG